MPRAQEGSEGRRRFNPRPPLLAGDAAQPIGGGRLGERFNPRPPLLAGDAPGQRGNGLGRGQVSIRARHCWRAMPRRVGLLGPRKKFQSAPAIAGGRCLGNGLALLFQLGFNPRPPLLAGDAWISATARPWRLFQSAPAIAGGRCR